MAFKPTQNKSPDNKDDEIHEGVKASDKMQRLKKDVEKKEALAKSVDSAINERVNVLEEINRLKVKDFCDSIEMRTKGAVMVFLNPDHPVWKEITKETHAFQEQVSTAATKEQRKEKTINLSDKCISLVQHAAAETDELLEKTEIKNT